MKKTLATLLAASLVVGLFTAAPALAGKKKKKKKKAPVTLTFEESGSMSIPGPTSLLLFGVTDAEFILVNECASLPTTQGVDAHVVEFPEEFRMGTANVEVVGTDATGAHDINLYFYDAGCGLMDDQWSEAGDPSGVIPAGATYAVVTLFQGANATFDLKATVTK